jgi:hypothetical protein
VHPNNQSACSYSSSMQREDTYFLVNAEDRRPCSKHRKRGQRVVHFENHRIFFLKKKKCNVSQSLSFLLKLTNII